MSSLVFLKLGGSLITDKSQPGTARLDVIEHLAYEIHAALAATPDLHLVIGHGSGSFGHVPAKKNGTVDGVHASTQWAGFAEVWYTARLLNQIVIKFLVAAGLPAVAFPPSAGVLAEDRSIVTWDLGPMKAALEHNLLPVVNGDVVFDNRRGGTILSTEDLFGYLACQLTPDRILIAGSEPGVWADYPHCSRVVPVISPDNLASFSSGLGESAAIDVTGGMAQKVTSMLKLAQKMPGLEILIFSGREPGDIQAALQGAQRGTMIRAG